ncbi:uncharacterized protein LOC114300763 isoform X1 [Camellia sinensis]|uniref:uncharacterized protein LOC114300763 isoform X1 n=1 Tax=Camellia sinensis TaxID=4442 RepID=UPI00103607F9|nr:uncharacterized protein LOC114300763 isoform X1 [Camellia sinensis]
MGTDLDPLDEIFPERIANKARAGGKFQPKAKASSRKEPSAPIPSTQSVQVVDIAENELTALVGPSLVSSETVNTKKPLENSEDSVSGVHSSDKSVSVSPSLEHFVIEETLGHNVGLHSDITIPDINGDWNSTTGKSAGESADIFFGLESFDDVNSQPTTATVSAASRPSDNVDPSIQLRNEFIIACPGNNDSEGSLASPEIPTVHVSDTRSAEKGALILDNRRLEIEEAEAVPCLETLDNLYKLTPRPEQRSCKFQPKPKIKIGREKPGTGISHANGVESVPCFQDALSIPSNGEYILRPNDILDFSSSRFGDSISELPVNEEPTNHAKTSHPDKFIPGKHPEVVPRSLEKVSQNRRKKKTPTVLDDSLEHHNSSISGQENEAGRSMRQLRKRTNACRLVDESEDEASDDENYTNECSSDSLIDENDNDDGINQDAKKTRNTRVPRKSNKSASQKEKPVRKHKKVKEVPDQTTREPPKKFSHSTRRKRRQVDKVLLEIPEEEIDFQSLSIREIILLAEYRERMSSKEGKTSEPPSTNQRYGSSPNSFGNPFTNYNEDENFESEQGGGSSNDPANPVVQESSNYPNYQSYMKKTPRSRWSKQDTELFYEAVRQFGTDISMIQQLFPGRTRNQVKLKYKKEECQQPLRLQEALTNRAEDHSHYQLVIERLQQLAAEEKQNSYGDDSIGLTGNEEEANPEINGAQEEEVAKPEQGEEGEVQSMEPEVSQVQSPVNSYDSEDELCRWSQYKSEF